MTLTLRNPHSVLAALDTRPKDVLEIVIPQKPGLEKAVQGHEFQTSQDSSPTHDLWLKVAAQARSLGIRISSVSRPTQPRTQSKGDPRSSAFSSSVRKGKDHRTSVRANFRRSANEESQRTGVAEAMIRERASLSLEELFQDGKSRKEGRGLWLALDTLQDPHNVGAIFRTAAYFSVEGIILTQDRSAPMTATVYDVASGGVEYVPFVQQTSLQRAIEVAKDSGLWILGTSEHAKSKMSSIERDRPWLLVLGNEEKGMRRLTEESCDMLCRIPGTGNVTSLNVSVAAGIMISKLSQN